jgi:nucleoside-diphosphate kinase
MERTLAIIKPDAFRKKFSGNIIAAIENTGFKILAMKLTKISKEQAGEFYLVHKERPFYADLTEFMCSGKIIPIALEKENAIADFRALIGNTDPALADDGTLRKLYGESKAINAIHGSDSIENGEKEIAFFFSTSEIVENLNN